MFEVGKTYETKLNGEYTCIAVSEKFAFLQAYETSEPYAWTHDGKSMSLSSEWDIKLKPREFWIYNGMVTDVYHANAIHVREVLE
jgi:hypothetical protein